MSTSEALQRRYGATHRADRWWVEPTIFGILFGTFVVYATVSAMLLGEHWKFEVGPYLSPFFEPLIRLHGAPAWFSPALLILWAPLGFRSTCYYYRRAYYRAYFLSPPGCAIAEPAKHYTGESRFPLIVQNVHRYFMYGAVVFIPLLWIGAIRSYWYQGQFGVGLGSLILTANAFFLMMYTVGCHSLRHLVAGGLNQFSRTPFRRLRYRLWEIFTVANEHHKLWAWVSLITVGLTDLYIHLVANGNIVDPHTWRGF